jgi:hypothetical protein
VAENRREEQKLWLILFQIKAIRMRLNLLALQYWLFSTLAVLIGATALVFLAAIRMPPLGFLAVAVTTLIFALTAMVRIARAALRECANPSRAAIVADQRALLKGRLATVQALASNPPPSALWPYLVEETYGMRAVFEPARIEPRWISRSLLALVGVCAMVFVVFVLLGNGAPSAPSALANGAGDMVADLSDLDIRSADPGAKANARLYADPATLRQLDAKAADAAKQARAQGGFSHLMNKARRLAGDLQDQVTGREQRLLPPIHLRALNRPAVPTSDQGQSPHSGQAGSNGNGSSINSGNGGGSPGPTNSRPPATLPGDQADRLAQNQPGVPISPNPNQPQPDANQLGSTQQGGPGNVAGANHSGGSDPEHLFGAPTAQELGSDSFHLTVDALPSDEASSKGAPAYIPPKISVPLNSHQAPDEPLARAAIPADDRMTIKRVFER